jgi:hypothetical protein
MHLHSVTATDENGNDFAGLTLHPDPAAEQHVPVWVYVDGENGWNANVGEVSLHQLKKLDDGKFGA